jgi:GT2 family glycosyltransferase
MSMAQRQPIRRVRNQETDETLQPLFCPTRIVEIELGAEIPHLNATEEDRTYRRALALVRLHSEPLGLVELELGVDGLTRMEVAATIWSTVRESARAHLEGEGIPVPAQLPIEGLPSILRPRCVRDREALLTRAPLVSVIVATRERPAQLVRCLNSVLALNYPSYEVIVVDSGPTSSTTRDMMQGRFGETITYVGTPRRGLALAHNYGLLRAEGAIVAFVDDDVVVDSNWLTCLVAGFGSSREVACVTGLILPLALETVAQDWVVNHARLNKGLTRKVFDLDGNRSAHPLYPYTAGTFGSGANMAFSAPFLQDLGGFDVALGAGTIARGGDDLAAFFEVLQRGCTLVYEPSAIVWHDYRDDTKSLATHFFTYGVGLSAYLTKTIVDRPGRLVKLATLLPRGIVYMLRLRSAKQLAGVPRHLVAREWVGMLVGPIAYVVSRARMGTPPAGSRSSLP